MLAISRRRRGSSTDKSRHTKLCALAQNLNHYFLSDTREGYTVGYTWHGKWKTDRLTGKLLTPCIDAFEIWTSENEVAEKEADSLTSEWRKLGVERALEPLMDQSRWGWHRRHLF